MRSSTSTADEHPNSDAVYTIPKRPTGMRHESYDELLAELTQAWREGNEACMARAERLVSHFRSVTG